MPKKATNEEAIRVLFECVDEIHQRMDRFEAMVEGEEPAPRETTQIELDILRESLKRDMTNVQDQLKMARAVLSGLHDAVAAHQEVIKAVNDKVNKMKGKNDE